MLTKTHTVGNPFGSEWIEQLRIVLPTIDKLNISKRRILIDGNRRALFITGHNTKNSKAHFGMTQIYPDGTNLKIRTTALTPHILIGVVFPIVAIIFFWITGKSIVFNLIGTFIFIWNPIYYIRDLLRQDKFSHEIRNEINQISK